MTNCKLCDSNMDLVWVLENSPIVNNYKAEPYLCSKATSQIFMCSTCQSLSNIHKFTVEEVFENYAYRSFDNPRLDPIVDFLSSLIQAEKMDDLLEIGCNNGVFLEKVFSKNKFLKNVLGIDPSAHENYNKSEILTFRRCLFDASAIKRDQLESQFDLVICRHMLAHNPDPILIAQNISKVTKPGGFVYIENASFYSTIKNRDFSQMYVEHFFSLSPDSIKVIFDRFGFQVYKVKNFDIHNGSFGIILKKSATKILPQTSKSKYVDIDIVKKKITEWEDQCLSFFKNLPKKNVYIWGVTAKTVLVLNLFKINTLGGSEIISGAVDFSSHKIDCFLLKIFPIFGYLYRTVFIIMRK